MLFEQHGIEEVFRLAKNRIHVLGTKFGAKSKVSGMHLTMTSSSTPFLPLDIQ